MATLNSYVDFVRFASNLSAITIASKAKIDTLDQVHALTALKNAGIAGDEEAAKTYVNTYAIVYTDLQGNVDFDLTNEMIKHYPAVGDGANYKRLGPDAKEHIQGYYRLAFDRDRGRLDDQEFYDALKDLLFD